MRRKPYRTSDEVFLALLEGTKKRSIKELMYRKRKTDNKYAQILEEGLNKFEDYEVRNKLKQFIDPEKMMTEQEWNDMVGLKD